MNKSIISMDDLTQYIIEVNKGYLNGQQVIMRFDNDFGASIIRNDMSYGHLDGLFEIAVIKFNSSNNDDWKIVYDTPITSDVLGGLSRDDVMITLRGIQSL